MVFMNEVLLLFSMTFLLADGYYSEKPLISVSCEVNGLLAKLYFKNPFSGVVFARGYYSNPYCSSPNLPNITTKELQISFPLFACGTQLQRRKNKLHVIKNTIEIQYHTMMKTIYDSTENISCVYIWPVPHEIWAMNKQRNDTKIPVFPYRSWLNFKLGNDVMGEKEAKKKGVSYKLFLVVYVQDGGRNKDVKVGKCFAHDDHILTENTTVVEMNPIDNCSDSGSLSEFTVRPYLPVSDLMAYAEVRAFNISTKGELFITCGMQLCEKACFRGCPQHYRHVINHWSTVSTHRLTKRAADDLSSAKVRNLENRNVFLRSTVKALSEKLLEYKAQLNAQKNGTNFDRRVSKALNPEITSTEESINIDQVDLTLTEKVIEEEGDVINDQFNSSVPITGFEFFTVNDSTFNSSVPTTEFEERLTVNDRTLNSQMPATDSEEHMTVKVDEQLNETVALQNTTIFLPTLYTDYLMTTGLPIYNRSTASYEPSTVYIITSDDALSREKSSGNVSVDLNVTNTAVNELIKNPGIVPDCVPHFKFLVVTISLGILSFSFFLICVGLWLYIRKERKRTALNSYLLYSFQ